ncbi:MAG: outer membrane beta-barrel protein [Prevotellaceae bacterium]|jgi:hypothetical protein|nr:outer membrane beta-barrel protein [Prevotellaceae bacterium]
MRTIKFFIIFLSLALAVSLSSQVRYGVEAGYIFNGLDATNVEYKSKPSFRIGGIVRYDADIESGIYFSRRGMSLTDFAPKYADKIEKIDLYGNYIELVPFSISLPGKKIGDKFTINIDVGLYASYCLGAKGSAVIDGQTVELKNIYRNTALTVNGDNYDFKAFRPFDCGLNAGFKFVLCDKIFLRVYGSNSFINLTKYDKRISYVALGLSAGYML